MSRVALRPSLGEADDPIVRPASESIDAVAANAGRYLVYGEIARGGMGVVLRAHDQTLGRDLAIKVLLDKHLSKPEMLQRFMEEAQVGGQLQHPGIVPVYELNRFHDKRPFFTMKLVKGKSLASLLRDRKDKSDDRSRFLRIFLQVSETMSYAHSRGVIHRDLKPSNIMVGAFGEVQVMDWGLAKVLPVGGVADERHRHEPPRDATVIRTIRSAGAKDSGSSGHTLDGSVLGTPAYMPPEQAAGEIERLDERCDVFGLGAILCQILTGAPPYDAPEHSVVQRKAILGDLREAFERLDDCGADNELVALCKKCLSANREGRPRDAGVLSHELAAHFEATESRIREAELTSARMTTKAEEERKRKRVTVALAATIFLALSLAGASYTWLATERAARDVEIAHDRLQLSEQVNTALTEAARHQEQARNNALELLSLAQARESVRRAEALLAAAASDDDDLRERTRAIAASVEQQERERDLLKRLEAARAVGWSSIMQMPDEQKFLAYESAFALVGIDRAKQTPAEVAARVRAFASPLREQLVVGLFNWAECAPERLGFYLDLQDNSFTVQGIEPGSPAAEDGRLRVGQKLVALSPDAQSDMVPTVDLTGDEVISLLHGSDGQPVRLKIRSTDNAQEQVIALIRGKGRVWLRESAKQAVTDPTIKQIQSLCEIRDHQKLAQVLADFNPTTQSPAAIDVLLESLVKAAAPSDMLRTFCQRCQIAHPNDYWLNFRLAMLHLQGPQPSQAIRYHQAALVARPQDAGALLFMAFALTNTRQYAEAETYCRRALTLSRDDYTIPSRVMLATALEHQGKFDEAIAQLEKAFTEVPNSPYGRLQFGRLLARQGRIQEAVVELRKAIGGNEPAAYVNCGICLFKAGSRDEAVEMFRRAIEFDGSNAFAHFNLGAALAQMGQTEPAKAAFARGLELAPKFIEEKLLPAGDDYLPSLLDAKSLEIVADVVQSTPPGHLLAAEARQLLESGQPEPALAKFREAVQLNPGYGVTRRSLAEALAITGDEQGAIKQLAAAVKADPTDLWSHRHLVQYTAFVNSLDDYRSGRSAMLAQFANSMDPLVLERSAKACLLLPDEHEDVRTAAKWAAKSVDLAGESHWALTYLYLCRSLGEYRLGQYDAAAKSARQALSQQFENWRMQVPSRLLLAMTDHRMERKSDARRRLFEAARRYRSSFLVSEVDVDPWICDCLFREAVKLILSDDESGPDNSKPVALELVARAVASSAEQRYAAAATYYERALAAKDAGALDLPNICFYAAVAAANAAQGRGADGADLTDTQRIEHLERSQRWLRSYLDGRAKALPPNPAWERTALGLRMSSAAFAVFRDARELARQTPVQRQTTDALWKDAQALLSRLSAS
jgi:serine/threonine protein kinase/Flp pilus assembly protein TadD